ncbi:MAG: hypothetical protein U9R19_17600 [Bacteroidota bacterium]|nr:hypothetical protein [Bacteroidota bacterium]
MKNKQTIPALLGILAIFLLINACSSPKQTNGSQDRGKVRVMFYNVENLFDTYDDPEKNDEEFLPDGTLRILLEVRKYELMYVGYLLESFEGFCNYTTPIRKKTIFQVDK